MGGYRGDGYGMHGQYDDDDYYEEIREAREEMREDRRDNREDRREDMRDRRESYGEMYRNNRDWDGDSMPDDRAYEPGFMDRVANRAHYYLTGDERNMGVDDPRRRQRAANAYRRMYGNEGHEGQYGGGAAAGRSAGHDDHYLSWRDRHISEMDRDYEEWRREREQQFSSDFDSWRKQRRQPAAMVERESAGAMIVDESTGEIADGSAVVAEKVSVAPASPSGSRRRGSGGGTGTSE